MKLDCCRRAKHGFAPVVFILCLALMSLSGTLMSCAKKTTPANPQAGQLTTQPAQSLYGRAMQHAAGEGACRPNLDQVRLSIQMYRDAHDGQHPPSLAELGLPAKTLRCPVCKQDYQYDPTTGTVKCPFPGHEQY